LEQVGNGDGGESWNKGCWEIAMPIVIAQLKMEDVCMFCNVMGIFW
jgi:hypothetical protein